MVGKPLFAMTALWCCLYEQTLNLEYSGAFFWILIISFVYKCSVGFKSGDWLGHSKNFIFFSGTNSECHLLYVLGGCPARRSICVSSPSQQWHVGPRWGLHGRQMWAPLWACTRDPYWGQPWKPRRTKSGTCKGTAWVLIGQFMSARFGPHLPKGVKSGFAPGIHMGASRGCPDGF